MSERSGRMRLDVKGEGKINAGDIMTSADLNRKSRAYLATLIVANKAVS